MKTIRLFLFVSGLLHALLSAPVARADEDPAYRHLIEDEQRVLRVMPKTVTALRGELKNSAAQVVAGGEEFLVVRPAKGASPEAYRQVLEKLKHDNRVKSVEHDHLAVPLGGHTDPAKQETPKDEAKPRPEQAPAPREKVCRLGRSCGENGFNPAWPRERLGSPLAEKILEKLLKNKKDSLPTVAVIDTGFDREHQAHHIEAASFTRAKGHQAAGDPNIDTDGHGTAVCGMIAGREVGITKHVHLNFYRLTEANGNGSASDAFISATIEKACQESDIVNVSWGAYQEELEGYKIEDQLWYKKAVERGCLVVKAAGNSGLKHTTARQLPIESPHLTVAASNVFSSEAQFSSKGTVMAPGEGVYSLLACGHYYGMETSSNRCEVDVSEKINDRGYRPQIGKINGTSFSAPIVAAIAGQVLAVLNSRAPGGKLDPKIRIALIKKVLLASQEWAKRAGDNPPGVTSLTATIIASQIPLDDPKLDTDTIIKLAKKSPELKEGCEKPSKECAVEATCEKKRECAGDLNFKMLACQPPPEGVAEDKTILPKLFRTYVHLNEPDLVMPMLSRIPAGDPLIGEAQAQWQKAWDANAPKESYGDFKSERRAVSLLDTARRSGFYDRIDPGPKLERLLKSYRVHDSIRFEKALGTDPKQSGNEADTERLFRAFLSLPESQRNSFFDRLPKILDEYDRGEEIKTPYLSFLYYLKHHERELPDDIRSRLNTKLGELGEKWLEGKIKLDYSGVKSMAPALEMLLGAVPDGLKRLRAQFPDPNKLEVNDKNREMLELLALSPSILGDQRLAYLNAIVLHPEFKKERSETFLNRVAGEILRQGTPEMITGTLRKAMLENPRLEIPHVHDKVPEKNLEALTQGDFYNQVLVKKLELATRVLAIKGAGGPFGDLSRGLYSMYAALNTAKSWTKKQREEFFKGKGGELIGEVLKKGVELLVKADSHHESWNRDPLSGVRECVRWALRSQSELKELGVLDTIKNPLKPLEADMRNFRVKYEEGLRQDYARLNGLGDKFR